MVRRDLKIWVSYHKDEIYDEYKLGELDKNIFIPFNLSKTPKEDNINILHPYWNEICTLYYVWKNQKKSKWVGFCGYRRLFDNIVDINEDECLYITRLNIGSSIFQTYCEEHFRGDILNVAKYLHYSDGYDNEYNELINSNEHILNDCFIMSWDNFNKLCDFLFGILFYLDDLYHLNMKPEEHVKRYDGIFKKYGLKYTKEYQSRAFSFLAERLISIWITCNTKYKCVQNNVHLIDGRPYIVYDKNSTEINLEKSQAIIDNIVYDIKVNNSRYVFNICCDKSENDVIKLSLGRKASLSNILDGYNIPRINYIVKYKGQVDCYNNNSCAVYTKVKSF